jgi:signal transduction histidine kinase/ActR/RegA family two-component response regulator
MTDRFEQPSHGRDAVTDERRATRRPRDMTKNLLDSVCATVGLELCLRYRLSEDGAALRLESSFGVPDAMVGKLDRVQWHAPTDRPPVSAGADETRRFDEATAAVIQSLGIQAYVSHPLISDGHLVGTLAFGTKTRRQFTSGELALLGAVGDQVTLAIEHERFLGDGLETIERGWAGEEREAVRAREQAARAEAEEANRARDEFLAVLSHELRTPLNVMLGWVRMLQSGDLDPVQVAHALKVIERNIGAQTDVINRLLDVSRIVSGTLVLDMRPLDVAAIVEAAADAVRPAATAKGVEFEKRLGEWALRTMGDGARLQEVVSELLRNGVEATPAGGQVSIRLEATGDRARVIVNDTGEGIAPERLPHIFDRYRSRDRSSRRAHRGLGLGLALARRLVELHGGSITAASAGVKRGAAFTVELPLRRPESAGGLAEVEESEPHQQERLDLLRVLVVDDDADTRDLLSLILKERGATVVTARSVAEAYRFLTGFAPDVVLCDISMPGEDGFRLLDWTKAAGSSSRSIPVIALTAHARPEDRHRILSAGFKGYLAKPLEVSDIIRMISSVTGRVPGGEINRPR